MTGFDVSTISASVADAHALPMPDVVRREVWFFEPEDRAVVLGSTQRTSVLDLAEIRRRELGVVRRRSGGGAVVVEPGALSWFDVLLPGGDPLAETDVSRSALWLGDAVADALRSLGLPACDLIERATPSSWSSLVCFAGCSAGEVLVAGRKAVGISQRRTRAGARFQVMVLHHLDPTATAALFALDANHRARLGDHLRAGVSEVEVEPGVLRSAVEAALATR